MLVAPIITGVLVDFGGFSNRQAGLTAGYGGFGSVSVALLCALFMHRLPLRRLAVVGLIVAALTNLAAAEVYREINLFYLVRAISAFADGACYAAVMSSFARASRPERGYGLFMTLQFGLSGIALWALPTFYSELNVEELYRGFAVLNLLALVLVSNLPATAAEAEGVSLRGNEWRLILTVSAIAGLVALCAFEASNTASSAYLERIAVYAGLSDAEIGLVFGLGSLTGVVGAISILWLGQRLGALTPILMGIVVGAVSLYGLMHAETFQPFLIWTCIHSFTWAFTLPYIQTMLAQLDPGGAVVTAGGLASGAGGALGPSAAALMLSGETFTAVLTVGLMAYLIAAVAATVAGFKRTA